MDDMINIDDTISFIKAGQRQFSLSEIYNSIANEEFEKYDSSKRKALYLLKNKYDEFILCQDTLIDKILKPEFISEISNIKFPSLNDDISREMLANIDDYKPYIEYIMKSFGDDMLEIQDYSDVEKEHFNMLKAAIKFVTFEAFSVEALLNETVINNFHKDKIKKLERNSKGRMYLNKLKIINEEMELSNDIELEERIVDLMQRRNKLAHFKKLNLNAKALANLFQRMYENNEIDNYYLGDELSQISEFKGVYERLFSHINSGIRKPT